MEKFSKSDIEKLESAGKKGEHNMKHVQECEKKRKRGDDDIGEERKRWKEQDKNKSENTTLRINIEISKNKDVTKKDGTKDAKNMNIC